MTTERYRLYYIENKIASIIFLFIYSRKKKSFRERYTVYGTPEKNSFKSYMSYRAVSSSSAQGKLQAKAKTDSKTGIRKVDGRYCVIILH